MEVESKIRLLQTPGRWAFGDSALRFWTGEDGLSTRPRFSGWWEKAAPSKDLVVSTHLIIPGGHLDQQGLTWAGERRWGWSWGTREASEDWEVLGNGGAAQAARAALSRGPHQRRDPRNEPTAPHPASQNSRWVPLSQVADTASF